MVRMPEAAGQVRTVPVKVLRGIFAGIGQLLLAADRFRADEAERAQAADAEQHDPLTSPGRQQAAAAAAERPGEAAEAVSGQPPDRTRFRSLDSTGNVRILPAGEAPPGPVPQPLPVPGYDGLSLPSLRSRLRNLDAAQLRVLLDYEKSHAGRTDIVTMFERRIAKLASAGTDPAASDAS